MIQDVSEIDLPRVQAFLERYVETSLFLLSNLGELGYILTEHLNSGNLKYIEERNEICGVFCLARRGNILAQTGGRPDLAKVIIDSCESEPVAVQGVVAEWTIAEAVWKLLCANSRFHPTFTSKETLFSLELSSENAPRFDADGVRALGPNDFDQWVKLNTDYLIEEGLPVQGTITERRAQFIEQSKAGCWWGAFEHNILAATVALNATHGSLGQVGGVFTSPEKRRSGLARRAMQLLMNESMKRHHLDKLILFTGEHNIAARELYLGLGFTNIGHFGLLFGSWESDT